MAPSTINYYSKTVIWHQVYLIHSYLVDKGNKLYIWKNHPSRRTL